MIIEFYLGKGVNEDKRGVRVSEKVEEIIYFRFWCRRRFLEVRY